jgi:hypothetical protein
MSSGDLIPAETILAQNAEVIRALGKRVVGDIIEIGRRLTESKQICGHGNWLPWLDREFGWGESTAQRSMQMHALVGKSPKLMDLDVPVSGLYMLAAPSTPEEAQQQVIERPENGERLSVKAVKELIDEARNQQKMETAELFAVREAQIRAEYVPGSWTRKPPPEPEDRKAHYAQFIRTKAHPVAELCSRLMTREEFAGLVKSIKTHGQCDPIVLVEYEGSSEWNENAMIEHLKLVEPRNGEWVILDGRCREIACVIAGVEPKYKKIKVDDPRSYIVSVNLLRASYSPSQCAMAEAMLTKPDEDEVYDPDQLAPPIVAARYVLAHSKMHADAVIAGTMNLRDAYDSAVDAAWRMQPGPEELADIDWLRSDYSSKGRRRNGREGRRRIASKDAPGLVATSTRGTNRKGGNFAKIR